MRKSTIYLCLSLLLLTSCALPALAPPNNEESPPIADALPTKTLAPDTADEPAPTPEPVNPEPPAEPLAVFPAAFQLAIEPYTPWTPPDTYAGMDYALPVSLTNVDNIPVTDKLTSQQLALLSQNGFVVLNSQERSFVELQQSVGSFQGQPYYASLDSALHAFHLSFSELLKSLERDTISVELHALISGTLDTLIEYRPYVAGTAIESELETSIAYLSVSLVLLDPAHQVDPLVADIVDQQIQQILAGGGKAKSTLFPDFMDDYGSYKPVGHYNESELLQQYFRTMTWLGRVHFKFEKTIAATSRVPLIITLAMRQSTASGGQPATYAWVDINTVLGFLIGPSDDGGPLEYAVLMDEIYGAEMTIADLNDPARWEEFFDRQEDIPVPQINSTFVDFVSEGLESERGWRFMGQRFTFDSQIFQQLIFDMVMLNPSGGKRSFPSGLDVMAVLGSDVALDLLRTDGAFDFEYYPENMAALIAAAQNNTQEDWLSVVFDNWLYAFMPIVQPKTAAYPAFMQTQAWALREMGTALGSWAQLKHDTVLYVKMPEGAGGGGPPSSGPAPAYVEPNPEAFYRLAYLARNLGEGLSNLGYDSYEATYSLFALQETLTKFALIAEKQINGEEMTVSDFGYLRSCFNVYACMGRITYDTQEPKPVALIAAVSGAAESVLEVATGNVNRIYVVVPINGQLTIAQGGVYSYYEFIQPRDNRLTDEVWRDMLAAGTPTLPEWMQTYTLNGGEPVFATAFRVGDWYLVTEEGLGANIRTDPSTSSGVVAQFEYRDYVQIIEGPITADGFTWWKIELGSTEGWIAESGDWYDRAYGQ